MLGGEEAWKLKRIARGAKGKGGGTKLYAQNKRIVEFLLENQ